MPLYRRVFPVWYPRSWDPTAPIDLPKNIDFDQEKTTEQTMTD